MIYQQGDVIIERVDIIPSIAKKVTKYPVILAQGKTTGHAHSVLEKVKAFVDNELIYIDSDKPFTIEHQEHNRVEVPAGIWRVRKVREYDHFAEEARNVRD